MEKKNQFLKALHPQTERRRRAAVDLRKEDRRTSLAKRRLAAGAGLSAAGGGETAPASSAGDVLSGSVVAAQAMEAVQVIRAPHGAGELVAAVASLCRALSHPTEPPTAAVVASGVVAALARLLAEPNDELQLEVLRCLTNIAADDGEDARSVLDSLPHLVALVAGGNVLLREQSCWVLGNLAADEDDLRCAALAAGALNPLVEILLSAAQGTVPATTVRTAAWAIGNMARPGETPVAAFFEGGLLPALPAMLAHPDEGVAAEVVWILTFISARDDAAAATLVEGGVVPALVHALHRSAGQNPLATPVLRAIGNLVSIEESFAGALLAEPSFLGSVVHIMAAWRGPQSPQGLAKEATWVVANVASGPAAHRQAIVGGGFLPILAEILAGGQFDLRRQALFALRNLLADPGLTSTLLDLGILPLCINLLRTHDCEAALTAIAIVDAFLRHLPQGPRLVEEAGGLEVLDDVHYGEAPENIRFITGSMVDEFYGEDYGAGDDDAAAAAAAAAAATSAALLPGTPGSFSFSLQPGTNLGQPQGALVPWGGGPPPPPRGRGRDQTLPSWMANSI